MTTIAEDFALLTSGKGRGLDGSQVVTRGIRVDVAAGPVLIALDGYGQRHLLVPAGEAEVPSDHASQGVSLDKRVLLVDGEEQAFADLACLAPTLSVPFEALIADVASRLPSYSDAPITAITTALSDWRTLLKAAMRGMSRDEIVGLIAELEVLERLADADPVAAVAAWEGPARALHDFSRDGRSIEVKATAAVHPTSVRVSNLDQLDRSLVRDLKLAFCHLKQSSRAPSLEERIDGLLERGVPEAVLAGKLADTGYVRGMSLSHPTRYSCTDFRLFEVGPEFPILRASDLPEAIRSAVADVQYDLVLAALPEPLPTASVDDVLKRWVTSA